MHRTLCLLLTAILACLSLGCDPRANATANAETRDAAKETRIIALAPALGVILQDLGLEDDIVGKHAWDMALGRSIPAVGTHDDPDLEAILRLKPTHIVVQDMETRVPESLRRTAEREGWTLWGFPLLTLDDIATTTDELHLRLVGEPARDPRTIDPTEHLARERPSARLADAWSDRGAPARAAGRILLLANVDPAGAMGPGSFHHQLIERLGARPAITAGGPWQELDHEDILRLAPDAILLFRPTPVDHHAVGERPRPTAAEAMAALRGIGSLDIPAVRAGRVAIIDHPLGLLPASSLAEVAEEIAQAFEDWPD
ncbi:MAG: ABC transporter substrate-binding protein [Phycisphaerales bacterium]|nr:ABC transporter substrate-binding protein [Planctomycetota bacterium]MCH8509225.1 ABC transporter substrate-binding protein [Phycisphaerales bacterium]